MFMAFTTRKLLNYYFTAGKSLIVVKKSEEKFTDENIW